MNKIPVVVVGYLVMIMAFFEVVKYQDQKNSFLYLLAYFTSYEVLCRMAKVSPFMPYELGKYLMLFGVFFTLIFQKSRNTISKVGATLFLLILPSLLYIDFDEHFNEGVVFNFFGFLSLILLLFYFDGKVLFLKNDIEHIFLLILMPIISILTFLSLKSPDLDKFEYTLGALTDTAGGFGSNQVATILGIGMLIGFLYYLLFGNLVNTWKLGLPDSLLLVIYAFFRGLLTFSRGGMFGGVFPIVMFFFQQPLINLQNYTRKVNIGNVFLIGASLTLIAFAVNEITNNQLLLRYQGETQGTMVGSREKDLNSLTSGRLAVSMADVEVFYRYPIMGCGPGKARFKRIEMGAGYENTHVEVTRILAEHGIFGIAIIIIFLGFPFSRVLQQPTPLHKFLVGSFFFMAVFTSFHSATRTMVTPFFFALASSRIILNKSQVN